MDEVHTEQVFLETVIKALASQKDQVKITRSVDEMGVLYTVSVAKVDVAKIIGKNGDTAKAIRSLVRVVAYDSGVRATVKIDAPYIVKRQPTESTTK